MPQNQPGEQFPDMPSPSVPVNGAVIHFQKTPCGRGPCPVFTLWIYPDGRAQYVGERNTPRTGTWERQLPPTQFAALKRRFESSGFWQLRDRYDGNIMDVSGTYLSFSNGTRTKQVLNRNIESPPAVFKQLETALEGIVSSGEWKQPGTNQTKLQEQPQQPAPIAPQAAPAPARAPEGRKARRN